MGKVERVPITIELAPDTVRAIAEDGEPYYHPGPLLRGACAKWVAEQSKRERDYRFGLPWKTRGWMIETARGKCIGCQNPVAAKFAAAAPRMAELLERFVQIESDQYECPSFGDMADSAEALLREIGWIDAE